MFTSQRKHRYLSICGILLFVCSQQATSLELSTEELQNVIGGVNVTQFTVPSAAPPTVHTMDTDNPQFKFDFLHGEPLSGSIVMQLYGGDGKIGTQTVSTAVKNINGTNYAAGTFSARSFGLALRQSSDVNVRYWATDLSSSGNKALGDSSRYVKLADNLKVYKIRFHELQEPDGDRSVVPATYSQTLVDKMDYQYSDSSASTDYILNNCSLAQGRTNFRFDSSDVLPVKDGAITPSYTISWRDYFRVKAASLDGNYFHIFWVADVLDAGGWADLNDNFAVLEYSNSAYNISGLVHEFGHGQGLNHASSSLCPKGGDFYNRYDNNVMCGDSNFPGYRIDSSQCSSFSGSSAGVTDFN